MPQAWCPHDDAPAASSKDLKAKLSNLVPCRRRGVHPMTSLPRHSEKANRLPKNQRNFGAICLIFKEYCVK
jgi:hypothetical protein